VSCDIKTRRVGKGFRSQRNSNYLIPVFGVLIAAAALGEHLTVRMAVGGLVVLASTLLVTVYEEHFANRARAVASTRKPATLWDES